MIEPRLGLPTDYEIAERILHMRGVPVMLDSDLARLYNVTTKVLKQAVRRNLRRFPADFMFELTPDEYDSLRSHFVTSKRGGNRYLPMVFTEHGILMLSSVLRSNFAIEVNIQIVRIFVKMRKTDSSHNQVMIKIEEVQEEMILHREKIEVLFEHLAKLEMVRGKRRRAIGFKQTTPDK